MINDNPAEQGMRAGRAEANGTLPLPKANSRNNEFLAMTKHVFNSKIYKQALNHVRNQGEAAAREYLLTFVTRLDY